MQNQQVDLLLQKHKVACTALHEGVHKSQDEQK